MGWPAHVIAEVQAAARQAAAEQAAANRVQVWPCHWHAVQVLRLMATQWRMVAGMGPLLRTGLDYAALPTVLAATRTTPHRQPLHVLLPQLQVMEAAVLEHQARPDAPAPPPAA